MEQAISRRRPQQQHGRRQDGDGTDRDGNDRDHGRNSSNSRNNDNSNTAETRRVMTSRFLFVAVLLVAAGLGSFAVYHVSKTNDEDDFKQRFADFADQILGAAQIKAKSIFTTFEHFSQRITLYAHASNQTFPFVTIPKFEAQFDQIQQQTGAVTMAFVPTVTEDQKDDYQKHQTRVGDAWIQDELQYAVGSNATIEYMFIPLIYTINFETGEFRLQTNQGVYAPISQTAPIVESATFVNFDLLSNPFIRLGYDAVHTLNAAVLSTIVNLVVVESKNETMIPEENDWPQSSLAVPIYKYHHATSAAKSTSSDDIAGLLTSNIPWHKHFMNIIPDGEMDLVLQNSCNQTCSYRISGPNVTFIGAGDHHDTQYNSYRRSAAFTPFQDRAQCNYTFHIYPTKEFEDTYKTNHPIIHTIVVIAIFLCTAIFFIVYDQLVERRQKKLIASAAKSSAIVTSLFPETVRERVLNINATSSKKRKKKVGGGTQASSSRQQRVAFPHHSKNSRNISSSSEVVESTTEAVEPNPEQGTSSIQRIDSTRSQPPIAEYISNVTIVFADIVNFHHWAQLRRNPVDTFALLETLYESFDKIANECGIFKVETIGNCYVGACGILERRDDHAILVYQFCVRCQAKSKAVLRMLSSPSQLGEDTSILQMRFGIHSGPVTAGVLRGSKSQFQLFGDTMNTAARIEAGGEAGKIHISEECATELRRNGKGGWLRERLDMIDAKGKGKLRTYWGIHSHAT